MSISDYIGLGIESSSREAGTNILRTRSRGYGGRTNSPGTPLWNKKCDLSPEKSPRALKNIPEQKAKKASLQRDKFDLSTGNLRQDVNRTRQTFESNYYGTISPLIDS
jgi:hypothetical protein